jgi:hypothetical protein
MSYGAETGKMILANLGCYKLKETPRIKTTNSDASTHNLVNPQSQGVSSSSTLSLIIPSHTLIINIYI